MSSAFLSERGLLGVLWDYWGCYASLSELGFLGLGGFLGFCCCVVGGLVLSWGVGWGVRLAPPFLLCPLTPALSPEGRGGLFIAGDGFGWCFGDVV